MITTNSENLYKEAQKFMPGGVNSPVRACRSVGRTPLFIDKAKGSYIYDVDGNKYIDYICSWGPNILGHCREEVINAVKETCDKGLTFGACHNGEITLAKLIQKHFPSMEMLRLVNSGTEAVMSAIRAARGYTGKDKIIKFEGCYHGHSDGLLVKGGSGLLTNSIPNSAGVPKGYTDTTLLAKYNDENSVEELFNANKDEIACVIAFVPELIALFFFLGILEDIGYMSRIAFIMDKIFRKFGLSGKSIIPLLISSGCGVPAIMSTKTIENKKQKIITVITTTNVPCSAKLQIIALISSTIFSNNFLVAPIIYFSSIIFVLISSLILSNLNIITTTETPFIMEIPNYHFPSLSTIFTHLFQRIKAFLIKAGTVLVVACIIIWLLSNFGFANGKFTYFNGENQNNSLMCYFSASISNLFYPLGFNNWQCIGATFSGVFAKENIVSSLNVFLNSNETIKSVLPTYSSAICFLVFNLLNSPCIASIIAMKKELVSKKLFIFALLYQNIFAYIVSLIFYQLIGFFLGEVQLNVFTIVSIFIVGIIINILLKKKPSKI